MSAPTLRSDAARNHEQIVASAKALFAARGLDVPVEQITRDAGVGMGTLYRHFPTKDDLIVAVLEDAFAEFLDVAEATLQAPDGWSGITSFLEEALDMHAANRGLRELVYSHDHNRRRATATRRRMRDILSVLVERARSEGSLRTGVTADDLLLVLEGGAGVIERAYGDAPARVSRFLTLVSNGLQAGTGEPR